MLHYNFTRMFKARGVERPYSLMIKAGIGSDLATRMKKNQVRILRMETLEKVCLLLHCTPNDVMEWTPDGNETEEKDQPLNRLRRTQNKVIDITRSLNSLPLEKLEEIGKYIEGQVNGGGESD
ncbi:MAG: helix-turn-helix transcriptional regulator [Bacteroidales bacterium]|nr:helix-turn-helix transcriptional regulator [Bacteroidales bacterium]